MQNTNCKIISIILTYLLPLALLAAVNASAAGQVQQEAKNGLSTTTFNTPQGRVVLSLPNDMRAGDTITGTVIAERRGSTEPIAGYSMQIADKNTALSIPVFTFVAPGAGSMPLILKNSAGTEVGRAVIPIQPASTAAPSNLVLPPFGQNGRPLMIPGKFDGDASNTSVTIGGKPVDVIAESPRKVVIQIPPGPNGPTTITVTEQGKTTTGAFRNVGVNLSAPKTSLMKGEKTTVTVQVSGLQGIKQNLPMDLVTTGVVNMEGGNTQHITIQPSEVQAGGTASLTRTLTGITPGTFNVTATVIVPRK